MVIITTQENGVRIARTRIPTSLATFNSFVTMIPMMMKQYHGGNKQMGEQADPLPKLFVSKRSKRSKTCLEQNMPNF